MSCDVRYRIPDGVPVFYHEQYADRLGGGSVD